MTHTMLREAFKAFAPDGVAVPVRTGRKDDKNRAIAKVLRLRFDTAPDAVLEWLITAAGRAMVAEKLNNIPTENGAKVKAAKEMFAAIAAGETPKAFVAAPRASGGLDPVDAEAVQMWADDLIAKVGAILKIDPAQRAHAATGRRPGKEVIAEAIATDPRFAAAEPFTMMAGDVWSILPPAQAWEKLSAEKKALWRGKAEAAAADRAALAEAPDVAIVLADLI